MEVVEQEAAGTEYRCPGQRYAISRAVHLGRLARFYPGCRQCPHREDTGTLSAGLVGQLAETRPKSLSQPPLDEDAAAVALPNNLEAAVAGEIAAALGVRLQRSIGDTVASYKLDASRERPVVAVAGDGRPLTCAVVAAVGEGLRWAGCHVVDVGATTAACLAFAVDHLRTDGGVLVGNPGNQPHVVGLRLFDVHARPLGGAASVDRAKRRYYGGANRPTRTFGALRRFQAQVPYLVPLADYYHALRPIKLVLNSASAPLIGYLKKLAGPTACEIVESGAGILPARQAGSLPHLAVRVDGDAERCTVLDERGHRVSNELLLVLLARELRSEKAQGVVVLEDGTPPAVVEAIGGRVQFSHVGRAAMAAAMQQHGAIFGGGSSGRFWHTVAGPPLPDALATITLLLSILSRSDRPFSEVLDRDAAIE